MTQPTTDELIKWLDGILSCEDGTSGEFFYNMTAIRAQLLAAQWKETVRDIYDGCIVGELNVANIIDLIEKNHRDYFCKNYSPQASGESQAQTASMSLHAAPVDAQDGGV